MAVVEMPCQQKFHQAVCLYRIMAFFWTTHRRGAFISLHCISIAVVLVKQIDLCM